MLFLPMTADHEVQATLEAIRRKYFDAEGATADLAALCSSPEHSHLRASLAGLEALDFKLVRIQAQMAFWLNTFNAGVVQDIAELIQAASIREVEAFFEKPRVRVAGFAYSLDDIQHGLLRGNLPKFGRSRAPMRPGDPRLAHTPVVYDERVHFALYCAARSSPPLAVFVPGRVDSQLEDATAHYLRRETHVLQEGATVSLPRQFYWYADDFGGEHVVLRFALARLDDAIVDLVDRRQGRVKVRYADFDWAPSGHGRSHKSN